MSTLPCLAHGRWSHRNSRNPRALRLQRVRWRSRRRNPKWGPFPVRNRLGILWFPTSGEGWFWSEEVDAARRITELTVLDTWSFVPECEHLPFSYISDMYRKRQHLKSIGDPGEYVLKLALNSTYGALAERPHRNERKPPPWRSLVWAGLITARTRATMLSLLDDDVVMIATDAIFATKPLDVPVGDGLGQWEVERYDSLWVAGTGFYFPRVGDEWLKPKTRGFAVYDMPRDELIAQWNADGRTAKVTKSRRRFIGMGTALHRVNGFPPPYPGLWRQWVDQPTTKTFDLWPRRRWLSNDPYDGRSCAPTQTLQRQTDRENRRELAARAERIERLNRRISGLQWVADRKRTGARDPMRAAIGELQRKVLILTWQQEVTLHGIEGTDMFARGDQPFGESDGA